ncbi:MAG: hypothetical protein OXI43_04025 [Candidatus Poribacteria bacterium]|nr:hypothetical protein [Candidatus Poribacteria bacterium]
MALRVMGQLGDRTLCVNLRKNAELSFVGGLCPPDFLLVGATFRSRPEEDQHADSSIGNIL